MQQFQMAGLGLRVSLRQPPVYFSLWIFGYCGLASSFKVVVMGHVEILGGSERRRRWSKGEKRRIVEESFGAKSRVVDVARRNQVAASLVFAWRRQAREDLVAVPPLFLPMTIADPMPFLVPETSGSEPERARRRRARRGLIEIELRDGPCIRVDAQVDGDALGRVLDVLARR